MLDVQQVRLRLGQAASLVLEPNPSLKMAVGSSMRDGTDFCGLGRGLMERIDGDNEIFTMDDVGNRSKVNIKDESYVDYVVEHPRAVWQAFNK